MNRPGIGDRAVTRPGAVQPPVTSTSGREALGRGRSFVAADKMREIHYSARRHTRGGELDALARFPRIWDLNWIDGWSLSLTAAGVVITLATFLRIRMARSSIDDALATADRSHETKNLALSLAALLSAVSELQRLRGNRHLGVESAARALRQWREAIQTSSANLIRLEEARDRAEHERPVAKMMRQLNGKRGQPDTLLEDFLTVASKSREASERCRTDSLVDRSQDPDWTNTASFAEEACTLLQTIMLIEDAATIPHQREGLVVA